MNLLRYLKLNEEDQQLGINILHTGHNLIHPDEEYPNPAHPASYKFKWESGRVLDEFQINYIIDGKGVFESDSGGPQNIEPGSIILLFESEWHRYRPEVQTGWNEYWIGFKGETAKHILNTTSLSKEHPVMKIGYQEKILSLYKEMIHCAKEEHPGAQIMMAGILIQIIGWVNNHLKLEKLNGVKEVDELINKSKLLLIEEQHNPISPIEVAKKLNVGYSWFRKVFKEYTGMAPGKYQLQQRIFKAKELLMNPEKSIAEISSDLGFETNFHFTKVFKEKTGFTPGRFRKKAIGKM
jgi:AraC-like DNA-binding protein